MDHRMACWACSGASVLCAKCFASMQYPNVGKPLEGGFLVVISQFGDAMPVGLGRCCGLSGGRSPCGLCRN